MWRGPSLSSSLSRGLFSVPLTLEVSENELWRQFPGGPLLETVQLDRYVPSLLLLNGGRIGLPEVVDPRTLSAENDSTCLKEVHDEQRKCHLQRKLFLWRGSVHCQR